MPKQPKQRFFGWITSTVPKLWLDRTRRRLARDGIQEKVTQETFHIISGDLIIQQLYIGMMDQRCQMCNAYKFLKESPHLCCGNGKYSQILQFP